MCSQGRGFLQTGQARFHTRTLQSVMNGSGGAEVAEFTLAGKQPQSLHVHSKDTYVTLTWRRLNCVAYRREDRSFSVLSGVVVFVGSGPSTPGFLNVVTRARATRWRGRPAGTGGAGTDPRG